ncbi:MAG: hypothetical protein AAB975_02120 [Patescibacteria group bacterium]
MNAMFFAVWMAWVRSLIIAVPRILNARNFKVWGYWTISVTIVVTGAFFYISVMRSTTQWSLMPLHIFFFYPLSWFVIIGTSIFASTFALVTTGWQEGFDKLPIVSPLFVAKETIMFPLWFPREIYLILRS